MVARIISYALCICRATNLFYSLYRASKPISMAAGRREPLRHPTFNVPGRTVNTSSSAANNSTTGSNSNNHNDQSIFGTEFVALSRIYSGQVHIGQRLFVLGPKFDGSKVSIRVKIKPSNNAVG